MLKRKADHRSKYTWVCGYLVAKRQILTIEIQGNRGVRLAELVLRRDLIFASILDGHVFYFQSGEVRVAIFVNGQLKELNNNCYYEAQINYFAYALNFPKKKFDEDLNRSTLNSFRFFSSDIIEKYV